jgi:hypothetical protein
MTYTVTWLNSAQTQLAQLWVDAQNRQEISDAANYFDSSLRLDPYRESESRIGNQRIQFRTPLGIIFDVSDADCLVTVYAVWKT